MCGIAGYISFGEERPQKDKLQEMFSQIEIRGRDASGFAYIENEKLKVVKAPITSPELIKTRQWKKIKTLPQMMIMHTRASTQGHHSDNENNHPILYEKKAMVHNGVINNEADFGIPEDEVDSKAIIKSWVENKQDITKVFASLEGSFAVAIIDLEKENTLTLFRHSNPIEVMYDTQKEILYFASTEFAVKKMVEEETTNKLKGFKIQNRYFMINFPDNAYWELTVEDGLKHSIHNLVAKPRVYTYVRQSATNYHDTVNKNYGYYGYDDDDWSDYNYNSRSYNVVDKRSSKKSKEELTGHLFLENLEPRTNQEYTQINEYLAASKYIVKKCYKCMGPSLIDTTKADHHCNTCDAKMYYGGKYYAN